ncbi:hypothetical protein BDN72DRAFT_918924 [Pluteus cervinus]|uniref:Uncharacterized protein n=1 Tax=Pluteus cervinus TaxID=181527 RepID=A0ACD3AM74_9AGAR|nr:hypothetical protein BDN72DRAFT_918924 [Pluteus cervinus]
MLHKGFSEPASSLDEDPKNLQDICHWGISVMRNSCDEGGEITVREQQLGPPKNPANWVLGVCTFNFPASWSGFHDHLLVHFSIEEGKFYIEALGNSNLEVEGRASSPHPRVKGLGHTEKTTASNGSTFGTYGTAKFLKIPLISELRVVIGKFLSKCSGNRPHRYEHTPAIMALIFPDFNGQRMGHIPIQDRTEDDCALLGAQAYVCVDLTDRYICMVATQLVTVQLCPSWLLLVAAIFCHITKPQLT